MNTTRVNQLADRIRELVAALLERRVKDPRLGFVTVTGVRLTGDLRDATIYYTAMGDAEEQKATAAALESATGMLRSEVGGQLDLRHTPSLRFELDVVQEQAERIEQLIARARESDAQLRERRVGAEYAAGEEPYRSGPDEADDEPGDTGNNPAAQGQNA